MRLTLSHSPPATDLQLRRCAYLEALADSAVGVPLGPAARWLTGAKGRGRHGNALQWHFGLEPHDGRAELDWENRIELKLVSVWRRADGSWACDKLKVCETGVDPWAKLGNVLFVFADRRSRVVLGSHHFVLRGEARVELARSWDVDPHFGDPALFVEARESGGQQSPAYYVSARWLSRWVLPQGDAGVGHQWDAAAIAMLRKNHSSRAPLLSVVSPEEQGVCRCPRCGAPMSWDAGALGRFGTALARHGMPLAGACALRGHVVVSATGFPRPRACSVEEMVAGVEARVDEQGLWRLADRVPEPEDHLHGAR